MTNHVRTLLLNEPPAAGSALWPAERYVPPRFVPRAVPPVARAAYAALFPTGCDRAFKNLRLAQLLPLLHQPRFEPLTLAADPRVTYLPFAADAFAAVRAGVTVTGPAGLTVEPSAAAADLTRLLVAWSVDVASPAEVRLTGPEPADPVAYTTTAGLSSAVPLPRTAYQVRFPPAVGASWRVSVLTPPPSLAGVAAAVDRADLGDLFDAYPAAADAWTRSPHVTDRLAAVALAVAAALDASPPGVGL